MIQLAPDSLEIVTRILAECVPGHEVRVFGSRVTGNAKPYSDLDIVVMTKQPLFVRQMTNLKVVLAESDLPIKVDVVDWATTSEAFRSIILKNYEVIQQAQIVKMETKRENQVFLSYAAENIDMVREVYHGLLARGLKVWFDKEHLQPGKWQPQILKAIAHSRYFVICISSAALRKTGDERPGFQDKELQRAYEIAEAQTDSAFTIIPARLEDCDRGDHRLSIFQQYDLFPDLSAGLDKLALHMGGRSLADVKAKDERSEVEKVVERLEGKANAAYFAGEHEKAITFLDIITDLKPDIYGAWYNKGIAFNNLERYVEALAAYDEAVRIKPDFYGAWNNKGVVLGRLERHVEAIAIFDEAVRIKPDEHKAWYNKGNALAELGRDSEAITAYDEAVRIKPDFYGAWNNKGISLGRLERYAEAIAAFNEAVRINPGYNEAWYGKGIALDKLERYVEAIAAYDEAVRIKPDTYGAWHNKGMALGHLGRYVEALVCVEKALGIKPDYQSALKLKEILTKMAKQ